MVKIPDTEELVGATIAGRYRIDSVIGQGGMGSVFAATQLGIDRRVAVKVLRPPLHRDEAQAVRARTRFEREAKTLSRLSHPHTMRVFDYGHTESGNPYIVTELLEGKPLETVVEGEGSVAPIRAVRIISGVLKSLAEAHEAGIVHRDISAGNVFLVEVRDDPEFVKLIDFGLASDDTGGASVTRTGEILGTPLYMSPEQAQGKPTDERSDLYSTAVLLYEMLAGHAPFQHPNPLMVHIAHVERTPRNIQELVPGLPRALSSAVMACLEKDPARRFQSADLLRAALEQSLSSPIDPLGATQPVQLEMEEWEAAAISRPALDADSSGMDFAETRRDEAMALGIGTNEVPRITRPDPPKPNFNAMETILHEAVKPPAETATTKLQANLNAMETILHLAVKRYDRAETVDEPSLAVKADSTSTSLPAGDSGEAPLWVFVLGGGAALALVLYFLLR